MLDEAADALLFSLQSAAGRSITYRRGSASVPLDAVRGVSRFGPDETTQFVEELQTRDFFIYASQLVLSGSLTLPQVGDTIAETIAGITDTFTVFAPLGFPFRYSDSEKTILRVYTKRAP